MYTENSHDSITVDIICEREKDFPWEVSRVELAGFLTIYDEEQEYR